MVSLHIHAGEKVTQAIVTTWDRLTGQAVKKIWGCLKGKGRGEDLT